MVDLVVLQSISYIIAALSFAVTCSYYMINLREQTRNRRVALATNLLSSLNSKEGFKDFYELQSTQWTDFDDFESKYDSSVNPENWIKRAHWFNIGEHIGWQYKRGLVDLDTIVTSGGFNMAFTYRKFKPIFDKYWETQRSSHWPNLQFLSDTIWEKYLKLDAEAQEKERLKLETFKYEDIARAKENKQ